MAVAVASLVAVGLGVEVNIEVGNDVGVLVKIDVSVEARAICFAGAQALKSVIVKMKIKGRFIYMLFSRIEQMTFVPTTYFNPITSYTSIGWVLPLTGSSEL